MTGNDDRKPTADDRGENESNGNPKEPYVENPNGYGANYVNQPPQGQYGQSQPGQTADPNGQGTQNGQNAQSGPNPYGGQYYGQPGQQGQPGQPPYGYGQPYGGPNYGQPYAGQSYGQYQQNPYGAGWYGQPGQPGAGPAAGPAQPGSQGPQGPQYGQPYAYAPRQHPGQPGQPGGQGGQNNPNDWYAEFSRTDFNPFKLIEERLPQKAKNWIKAVYAVVGAAELLIGLALLVWPGPTLVVATIALAIYFIISGIVRAVTAFAVQGVPAGWRVLDVVVGVLLAIGGIVMLKNTTLSASTLLMLITSLVGIGWIMEGVMSLVESWRVPSSGWAVAYGLISVFAGFVVLVSPMQSTVFLVVFAGCALIVMGVTAIVRAFKFGRVSGK